MNFRDLLELIDENSYNHEPDVGDIVEIELGDTLLETYIIETTDDGVIVQIDETALQLMIDAKKQLNEGYKVLPPMDTERYSERAGLEGPFRTKSGKVVYYDSKEGKYYDPDTDMYLDDTIDEAKYQGREVPLGKPMAGDVKKSKVYVKGPKGNVVKVNFGDKNMKIKKSNPKRRKSFRARHRCENPGPRWKARYWSCRAW